MKNVNLNAGGVIGALACAAIAAAVIFTNVDSSSESRRSPYRLVIVALIGGAAAGNFLWGAAFKKSEPDATSPTPETLETAENDKNDVQTEQA